MALRVLPDAELLAINFVRTQPDVVAGFDGRVYVELPSRATYPLGLAFRIGGIPTVPQHFDHARIQGEGWADTKKAAHDVARILQAALHLLPAGNHELGIVTGVDDDLGFQWFPDPVTKKPRYIFGVIVHLHPHPA